MEQALEPRFTEYLKELTRRWREAKQAGRNPPAGSDGARVWMHENLRGLRQAVAPKPADLEEQIRAKEQEKDRLAKRLGLVEDEDAAAAVAARMAEVARDLRELRERTKPVLDEFDALRETVKGLLTRTTEVRQEMEEALPRQKGEYIRKIIRQIRVIHQERKMGKLRASQLVGVEIVPAVGQPQTFTDPETFREEGSRGRG
jgi:hypothetical protein